ncbi:MAG: InlB B-repeat-containing protein, partial [Firmicutes bacterium]|nr:InlB B-repeat-containing protein [Bacillota bacterium]
YGYLEQQRYLGSIDTMPGEDITFSKKDSESGAKIYYYVETINGAAGDKSYNGKNYKEYKVIDLDYSSGTSLTYREEFHPITGFTQGDSDPYLPKDGKVKMQEKNYLYYTRNSYNLKFYNYNVYVEEKEQSVQFEAPLRSYYFEPEYPSDLELNAYQFAGWYTTADCYAGSEADLSTMTMPASNVILYAKWVPKTHTVKTYLTKDAMDNGSDELKNWTVTHGSTVTNPPKDPTNGNYKFVGWFYDENGTEKAFDFSMPVNRDLNLYAKWSSDTLVGYTIHYRLEDGTEIAPDTTGSGLAGTTKTFDAKGGTQLNEGYQTGYFPKTNSHSLTFDIEGKNEFTFVYVPKDKVKYTVKYLEKGTEAVLREEKSEETSDAVITEKFEYIKGYAPDAYQKKLVLSADDNENVLIFWYTKDETHAPVQTIHWIQNIVGDGYTEYQSSTDLNGVIGDPYSATPIDITGFKFNSIKSNTEGTLTERGLVLNLFYDRKEYGYTFRFMEKGTNKQLAAPVTGKARYQAQVTESAKTIDGYTLVSNENQSITIGTDAEKNVKTFWYEEKTAVINYEVVGPDGCGSVSPTSETVNMVTGTANGSTATASNDAYKFVGWYSDQACKNLVSSDAEYVPTKSGTLWPASTTYYAKFDWNVADLTIKKTGANDIDANQSFIFHVTGEGKDMYVTVQGNGSVTIKGLTVGTYKVEEVTSWSWRYTPDHVSKNVEVKGGQKNEVTFNNSRTNGSWLSGDSCAINSVRGRR